MELYEIRKALMSGKTIYDLPLRVTYYARVSTGKNEQKNSLINQDDYYKNKILSIPKWTLVQGYSDSGITGTSIKKREDFNNMIQDGMDDKYDLILTKEVCRFARNTLDTLQFTRNLLARGKGIYFELDNINTLEQEGELRLTLMASLAQDESRRISERVKFGFNRAIEKGRVLGSNVIWGYEKDNCKLKKIDEEAEIVSRIFELYSTGNIGIRRIGKKLAEEGKLTRKGDVFAYSTIKNILTNPKYKGFYSGNKTRVIDFMTKQRVNLGEDEIVEYKATDDVVPQIVDEKIWEKCNEIFKERSERAKSETTGYNTKYKYSGKIYCKKDGQCYWRTISRGREFWQCALYKKKGISGCANNVNIYTETLDEVLKRIFNEMFINKEKFIENLLNKCKECFEDCSTEIDITSLQNKIESLKKEKKKLIKLYTTELIDEKEFEEENNIYNEKISAYEEEKNKLIMSRNKDEIDDKMQIIKKSFEKDFEFFQGIPAQLVDVILDKIKVERLDDTGLANLEIVLKVGITIELLYKKKKIIKYIDKQKIAS